MCIEYMKQKEKFIPLQKCSSSIGKIDETLGVPWSVMLRIDTYICVCVCMCTVTYTGCLYTEICAVQISDVAHFPKTEHSFVRLRKYQADIYYSSALIENNYFLMEVFVNHSGSACLSSTFHVVFPTHPSPVAVLCVTADRIDTAPLSVQGWVPASFHTEEPFLASWEAPEKCNTAKNIVFGV